MRFALLSLCAGVVLGVALAVGLAAAAVTPPLLATSRAESAPVATPAAAQPTVTPPADGSPAPAPTCVPGDLAQRAGQVLLVGLPHVTDPSDPLVDEVVSVGVGGVLLTKVNVVSDGQVRALVAALRRDAAHGLFVATDEEPGRVSTFRELVGASSSARTLAARSTPADIRVFAADLGRQLRRLGIDVDLAPVADLDDGPASGVIGDRAFSGDPVEAGRYALAFAQGLADAGVVPVVKHFPGHGQSARDSHRVLGRASVTLAELRARDLRPFAEAVAAGAPAVMMNHVAYDALDPELPASLSPRAYALLRDLGFEGVAMTDSIGMGAVNLRWGFAEAAVRAVTAGADVVLATDGNQARAMRDALVSAVRGGQLPEQRLDEAVARVLALKGRDPATLVCADAGVAPRLGGPAPPVAVER